MKSGQVKLPLTTIVTGSVLALLILAYPRVQVSQSTYTANTEASSDLSKAELPDTEDYAVYSAVIEAGGAMTATEVIWIDHYTRLGLLTSQAVNPPWAVELSPTTWNDFLSKNESSVALDDRFGISQPYRLSALGAGDTPQSAGQIPATTRVHLFQFSRVGFNVAKDEALIHVGVVWGMTGGLTPSRGVAQGNYYLLKKVNGAWEIQWTYNSYRT